MGQYHSMCHEMSSCQNLRASFMNIFLTCRENLLQGKFMRPTSIRKLETDRNNKITTIKKLRRAYLEVFDKQSHNHSRCTSHRTISLLGGSCGCWTELYTVVHQRHRWATHPPGGSWSTYKYAQTHTNPFTKHIWVCVWSQLPHL